MSAERRLDRPREARYPRGIGRRIGPQVIAFDWAEPTRRATAAGIQIA